MLFTRPLRRSWLSCQLVLTEQEKHRAVANTRFIKLIEKFTNEIKDREFPVFFDSPLARWVEACLTWIFQEYSFLLPPTDIEVSPSEFARRIRKYSSNPRCDYAASVLEALAELEPQE